MITKSLVAVALLFAVSLNALANVTRVRVENFSVEPGAKINVKVNGGSIGLKIGPPGQVHVEMVQVADTDSEQEADEMIAKAQPIIEKTVNGVRVALHEGYKQWSWIGRNRGVNFSVNLVVPAKVDVDLNTSGGSIKVDGEVQGELRADTSGGSIAVSGATGKISLDTSGGGITVDRVLKQLHADTSGGAIHIGYVGADVMEIGADTSGGGISIGLDPLGNYDIHADTSGGSVRIKDLAFDASKKDRTHAEGKINRGGAPVRADTSGGNIEIYAVRP